MLWEVSLRRRHLLGMTLALPMALAWRSAWAQSDVREWVRSGVARDPSGSVSAVFGLQADLAREVLMPATRADALPEG
jgi:hypothetical protein